MPVSRTSLSASAFMTSVMGSANISAVGTQSIVPELYVTVAHKWLHDRPEGQYMLEG